MQLGNARGRARCWVAYLSSPGSLSEWRCFGQHIRTHNKRGAATPPLISALPFHTETCAMPKSPSAANRPFSAVRGIYRALFSTKDTEMGPEDLEMSEQCTPYKLKKAHRYQWVRVWRCLASVLEALWLLEEAHSYQQPLTTCRNFFW